MCHSYIEQEFCCCQGEIFCCQGESFAVVKVSFAVVKVKNETRCPVTLKVYSSGVQTNLLRQPLEHGQEYTIRIDTNATYREYWCAANPGDVPQDVILSSDDCAEFSEVTLKADVAEDGSYIMRWEGTKSRNPPAQAAPAPGQVPPPPITGAQGPAPGDAQRSRCIIM
jgi:hypothetical protein